MTTPSTIKLNLPGIKAIYTYPELPAVFLEYHENLPEKVQKILQAKVEGSCLSDISLIPNGATAQVQGFIPKNCNQQNVQTIEKLFQYVVSCLQDKGVSYSVPVHQQNTAQLTYSIFRLKSPGESSFPVLSTLQEELPLV